MSTDTQHTETALSTLHEEMGAHMVLFSGYRLPLHYEGRGFIKEHIHTRTAVSLFDISHMGQYQIQGADRAKAFEGLLPLSICSAPVGKAYYTHMLNAKGGVIDDLIIANDGGSLFVVFNASRKQTAIEHINSLLKGDCRINQLSDYSLIALQGPKSEQVLLSLCQEVTSLCFMEAMWLDIDGVPCRISRGGYTGEDGFEISIPNADVDIFCRKLLEKEYVELAGLGARDSLRLEAGLCLYGNELNEETTPIEAGLPWVIAKDRRDKGGFEGYEALQYQLNGEQPVMRRLVGLNIEGKLPLRSRTKLCAETPSLEIVGEVTSGVYSPTLNKPIAVAYVSSDYSDIGMSLIAEVRGKQIKCQVAPIPFVPRNYKIGKGQS